MSASWYLQGQVYVGMSALRGFRVLRDRTDWWGLDVRDEHRKPKGFGPYHSAEDARDAALRRVAA